MPILWDTLLDLDDLTASTSSIMALLAQLLSFESAHAVVGMVKDTYVRILVCMYACMCVYIYVLI